ncbi:uncharacterized protein LOC111280149 isoform X2 [Durio zibethinus]|uniref:Uncharacterized protein LOC111280149 isoform X2 n=1 Tax=Durio zibethinus TaxID=66656 RepID=A0A6P5X3U8_DURZI|nr:uncharacterized protein LOC111280149 isoform X2 [Durio zibethinus]
MAASGTSSFKTLSKTLLRYFSTKSSNHNNHQQTHKFLDPNSFLGSWKSPNDPKEAEKKLAQLRRDYAKQVKHVRKEYIHEMELLRLEKLRKEEARKEAIRVANEERQRLKAEAAKVRAQERMVAEQEFRQILNNTLPFRCMEVKFNYMLRTHRLLSAHLYLICIPELCQTLYLWPYFLFLI